MSSVQDRLPIDVSVEQDLKTPDAVPADRDYRRSDAAVVHNGKVWVTLDDRREIGLPLDAFPWLEKASPEQQRNYRANPISIYWPDLEDGIDLEYFTGEWSLSDR